ncbi:MAG: AAA family ATPase, partial [Fusobacteriaceae bacterium]
MKLIYFWLEKYKCLNNFELNLDSNYEVKITDIEKEDSEIEVKIKKIPNIFGKSILGVTALVGKNGTGKSSILEVLSMDKNGMETKFVYIYSTDIENEYIVETNFLHLNQFEGYKTYGNEIFKRYIYTYNCNNNKKVFLDNLKERVKVIRYKSGMKKNFQNKESFLKIPKYNLAHEINYIEIFKSFQKKEDIIREFENVSFKIKLNENLQKFQKYNDLDVKNLKLINSLKNNQKTDIIGNKNMFIENYLIYNINTNFKEIVYEWLKISKKNDSKELLKKIELNPILKIDDFNSSEIEELKLKLKNKKSDNKEKTLKNILKSTWDFLKKIKCLKNDMLKEYEAYVIDENIQKISEFLKIIEKLNKNFFENMDTISIDFTKKYSKSENNKILILLKFKNELPDINDDKFEMQERVSDLFCSDLQGLSDGQIIYASIFSSIMELISLDKFKTEKNSLEECLIILLDEVELYLHPEWMRKVLYLYINYLSKMKNNKFQLIFATHSPFIISDLPKENVILLEKGDAGTVSK